MPELSKKKLHVKFTIKPKTVSKTKMVLHCRQTKCMQQ